ncbi:MAG: DNA repair protein RadC, partial [Candidatus Kapaibacterium sp.]
IGTGTRSKSALEVARELLRTCGDLHRLLSRDISEFTSVHGIAGKKAMRLIAALECSRRLHAAPFQSRKVIRSPEDVAAYYIPLLRGAVRETFRVLLLNAANQVFRENVVSEGSLNSATVHPREVFRMAITDAAANVILLHNHPSGNVEPSPEDLRITERLCHAGRIIDIKVLDHVIVAGESFMSFSQRGLI